MWLLLYEKRNALAARGGKKVENISRDYEKSLVDAAFILSESS